MGRNEKDLTVNTMLESHDITTPLS